MKEYYFPELPADSSQYFVNFHGQVLLGNHSSQHLYYPSLYKLNEEETTSPLHSKKRFSNEFKWPTMDITTMAFFPIGSIIQNQALISLPSSYQKPQRFRFENLQSLPFRKIGEFEGLDRGININNRILNNHTPCICLENGVNFNDSGKSAITKIIIPCSEIYRFYYLLGPKANREILSGRWETDLHGNGVCDPASLEEISKEGKNFAKLWIADKIPGREVADLVRIIKSPYGQLQVKNIAHYLRADSKNNKGFIKANFPYENTTIDASGKMFKPAGSNERYYFLFEIMRDHSSMHFSGYEFQKSRDLRPDQENSNDLEVIPGMMTRKLGEASDNSVNSTKSTGHGFMEQLLNVVENRFPNIPNKRNYHRSDREKKQTHKAENDPVYVNEQNEGASLGALKSKNSSSSSATLDRDQINDLEKKAIAQLTQESEIEVQSFIDQMKKISASINTGKSLEVNHRIIEEGEIDFFDNIDISGKTHRLENDNWRHKKNVRRELWVCPRAIYTMEIQKDNDFYYLLDYEFRYPHDHSMILIALPNFAEMTDEQLRLIYRLLVMVQGKLVGQERSLQNILRQYVFAEVKHPVRKMLLDEEKREEETPAQFEKRVATSFNRRVKRVISSISLRSVN